MVKFNLPSAPQPMPESPKALFYDLRRDTDIKFLWGPQERMLDEYFANHLASKDLAIQLPTGAGKTLVGLLIADYRRRANDVRAAFLCPTKQLCNQAARQAELYGIPVSLLVGPQADYDLRTFLAYQSSDSIAITTYSGIFNVSPRIDSPEILVCDDAHTADNYVSDLWTVKVSATDHPEVFNSLVSILRPAIPRPLIQSIDSQSTHPLDRSHVELVSTLATFPYLDAISTFLEENAAGKSFRYSWSVISPHLEACTLYMSPRSIEIRPVSTPTLTHLPFQRATQRIYMSATLAENGDLERTFGVVKIDRLPMPEELEKRATGRRLVIFPALVAEGEEEFNCAVSIVSQIGRALVLVPDNHRMNEFENSLPNTFAVLHARDVEQDMLPFVDHEEPVVLLLPNRYDGIDLPGNQCRALVIAGLPVGINLQERYLMDQLGAISQLRDRIRTRVTQAMGRCTRDESDYSVVLLLGDNLVKWFFTQANVVGMHPELQAEIELGSTASLVDSCDELANLANAFLLKTEAWTPADEFIVKTRSERSQVKDDATHALAAASRHELLYIYRLWDGQYEEALAHAVEAIDYLAGGAELRPYRSFWHHNAAVAARLAWQTSGDEALRSSMLSHLNDAARTSTGLSWLAALRTELSEEGEASAPSDLPWQLWFNEITALLSNWGIKGRKFAKRVDDAAATIERHEANKFEFGLEQLGRMLGARTHRWTESGAPDGLWIFGDWRAFVFEAKTSQASNGGVSIDDVRQALTHEQRVRSDKLIGETTPCTTIIISPREHLEHDALAHVGELYWMSQIGLVNLFNKARTALTTVRSRASDMSEETLLDIAREIYGQQGIELARLGEMLESNPLRDHPIWHGSNTNIA